MSRHTTYDRKTRSSVNVSIAETVETVRQEAPVKKLVFVLLDVSSSMEGERLEKALACIKQLILKDVCADDDYFGLIAFNHNVHTVTPQRPTHAVRWPVIAEAVSKLCGKGTCLWGAVLQAMDSLNTMRLPRDAHVDLVVLTDGEDNRSGPGAVNAVEERMRRPGIANFHAIFLACCGACVRDMEHIATGKKHVKVFEEASSSSASITRAFTRAKEALLVRRTTTMTITSSGASMEDLQSSMMSLSMGWKGGAGAGAANNAAALGQLDSRRMLTNGGQRTNKPCSYGAGCTNFYCKYTHPRGRTPPCRYADTQCGCTNWRCNFLHPKGYHS